MNEPLYKCIFCGGELSVDSEVPANELYEEDYDDQTTIYNMHCTKCNAEYEIIKAQ